MRFIFAALFIVVAAGSWDVWWHGAFGRDSFIEPPHLLLYAASAAALVAGALAFYRFRDGSWRRITLALLAISLWAPLDNVWHRLFGVEDLFSVLAVWSPPHLFLVAAIVTALWFLFPKLENDRLGRQFFGSLAISSLAVLLVFAVLPFHPLGPYRLWGPWGAVYITAILAGFFIASQSLVGGFGRATMVGAFFALLHAMQYHWSNVPDAVVPFHAHPPAWLVIGSVLAMAALIDIARKLPQDVLGGAAGLLFGAILFGSISSFDPEFLLAGSDVIAAIGASTAGGVIGGFLSRQFAPR